MGILPLGTIGLDLTACRLGGVALHVDKQGGEPWVENFLNNQEMRSNLLQFGANGHSISMAV